MPKQPLDLQRKNEHVFLAEKFYNAHNHDFDQIRLMAPTIPNVKLADVELSVELFGQKIAAPIYINAMTGGNGQVIDLNKNLALIAKSLQIPMALGSMSNYLKYPHDNDVKESYEIVRKTNPDGIILANVSAKIPWKKAQACIDLIDANALQVHVNAAQEMVMDEGEDNFCWSDNLQQLLSHIKVPVIIKEVGSGMSAKSLKTILSLGNVSAVDISGRGGTNFQQIENERNHNANYDFMHDWGLTTLESLLDINPQQQAVPIFASGGVRTPLDIVKCLVLGAQSVGIAAPILHDLQHLGREKAILRWQIYLRQVRELLALLGCSNVQELKNVDYRLSTELINFLNQK